MAKAGIPYCFVPILIFFIAILLLVRLSNAAKTTPKAPSPSLFKNWKRFPSSPSSYLGEWIKPSC
jgi:hypothetical protein